ncbi:hypothetical protein MKK88_20465 [Methylobacterium sp. E-005]|uniref:hypothetical protein n=1 Tax=Methylobacterium sp. E-005 TaxID=2836549 RepID=UPI001FB8EC86|nr:hypothetical protein [Methylobacterium sp. E-005]MCJ2088340.1 hypothetical protein [Methylobacterium sp. E-005]
MRPAPPKALDPAGMTRASEPHSGASFLAASGPILAMLLALGVVTATGLSQRSALPEAVEPWVYGYFAGRYPLFVFALVYGLAHLARVAAGPGPASFLRRIAFGLVGAAILLLAGLYPTFGGVILRAGFATGGMAFLTHQPLWLAYGLGAGAAAALFGGILGLFAIAANRPLRPRLRRFGTGALAFLTLWFGAAVIGLFGSLGLGPWPHRALRAEEAGLAALLLIVAALPHAAMTTLRRLRPAS